jgi:hypothetical protein
VSCTQYAGLRHRPFPPSVPAPAAHMHPAMAEDRLTGSRLAPDAIEAAAHPANDGITFMATHSAPPPIWPSCFRSAPAGPCRRSQTLPPKRP